MCLVPTYSACTREARACNVTPPPSQVSLCPLHYNDSMRGQDRADKLVTKSLHYFSTESPSRPSPADVIHTPDEIVGCGGGRKGNVVGYVCSSGDHDDPQGSASWAPLPILSSPPLSPPLTDVIHFDRRLAARDLLAGCVSMLGGVVERVQRVVL